MSDGLQDKAEGKLKETEGKLTDDEMREKQPDPGEVGRGQGQDRGSEGQALVASRAGRTSVRPAA